MALRSLAERSERSTAVMICAEDSWKSEGSIPALEEWFRSQATFETTIATLNLRRFRVAGWADLLADMVVDRSQSQRDTIELVVERWMRNREVFEYADMIVSSVSAGTAIALASDFSERPMGKPLP
ncbi:hypothetical protein FRC07_003360, partial [Ceratobasidium sp. 392]